MIFVWLVKVFVSGVNFRNIQFPCSCDFRKYNILQTLPQSGDFRRLIKEFKGVTMWPDLPRSSKKVRRYFPDQNEFRNK